MRVPRPRLTVRYLMALVAILALVMESVMLVGRSIEYGRKAEEHEFHAGQLRYMIEKHEQDDYSVNSLLSWRMELTRTERQIRRCRTAQRWPLFGLPDDSPAGPDGDGRDSIQPSWPRRARMQRDDRHH